MIRPVDRETVDVYQSRAQEWQARRSARFVEPARDLAGRLPDGVPRVDLGCGAGHYLTHLGSPVVALDAALAMVELSRSVAPDAWGVQADLEALPFRRGSLAGGWARASYLHLAKVRLPAALAELHQSLTVGAPVTLIMRRGDAEGPLADDDFPGRFFADWDPDALARVIVGAGFTVEELRDLTEDRPGRARAPDPAWLGVRATRARTLPDYVGPDLRVLFVGLNPSEYAADVGVGFARPGNRFWPAVRAAGLATVERDPRRLLRVDRVGMTDLVKRATPNAAGLTSAEYRDGAARVERLVAWLAPAVVCVVGLTGWRAAIDRSATAGLQPTRFGERPVYVMPNTSGVNAHASLADFVEHLGAVRRLADHPER